MRKKVKCVRIKERFGCFVKKLSLFWFGVFALEIFLLFQNGTIKCLVADGLLMQINLLAIAIIPCLWVIYLIFDFLIAAFDLSRIYQILLSKYFTKGSAASCAEFGVVLENCSTIVLFPDVSPSEGKGKKVWGWGAEAYINSDFSKCLDDKETVLCLGAKPKAFSEHVSMNLKLVAVNKENLRILRKEDRTEVVRQFFTDGKLGFDAPIHGECLILTADGKFVAPAKYADKLTWRINLQSPTEATQNEDFCAFYFENVQKEVSCILEGTGNEQPFCKTGILSLYLKHDTGEVGICTVIELGKKSDEFKNEKIRFIDATNERMIAEIVSDSKKHDEGRYCALIYAYAQKDALKYSEEFCRINKNKILSALLRANKVYAEDVSAEKDSSSNCSFETYFHSKLPDAADKRQSPFFIRSSKWSSATNFFRCKRIPGSWIWGVVVFVLVFILENILLPIITSGDFAQLSVREFFIALCGNFPDKSLLVLVCAAFVLATLVIGIIHNRFVEKRQRKILDKGERAVKHGNFEVRGIFLAGDFNGYDPLSVKLRLTPYEHHFPQDLKEESLGFYKADPDDGMKFVISEFQNRRNVLECRLDKCKYTDVRAVQQLVLHAKDGPAKKQLDTYREALSKLNPCSKDMLTDKYRRNLPPNALCAHVVVMTQDGYVVVMKRDSQTFYSPCAIAVSAEEQMSQNDIYEDKVRLNNWVERLCEEEMGLTIDNCNRESLGDIRVMSIFEEKDILNVAICIVLKLNITRRQLQAIMKYFPRKDYEGIFAFAKMEDVWNHYVKTMNEDKNKTSNNEPDKYHPTSIYRLYWCAVREQRFDIAAKILAFLESRCPNGEECT